MQHIAVALRRIASLISSGDSAQQDEAISVMEVDKTRMVLNCIENIDAPGQQGVIIPILHHIRDRMTGLENMDVRMTGLENRMIMDNMDVRKGMNSRILHDDDLINLLPNIQGQYPQIVDGEPIRTMRYLEFKELPSNDLLILIRFYNLVAAGNRATRYSNLAAYLNVHFIEYQATVVDENRQ